MKTEVMKTTVQKFLQFFVVMFQFLK